MISPQTALIYTMTLVSAVDRDMKDVELSLIGEIVAGLPAFADFAPDWLPEATAQCAEMLSNEEGLETVLDVIASALDEPLRETAYALALEVAAADGTVTPEEMRILEMLRHKLNIDRLVAAAIERGVRARYATI